MKYTLLILFTLLGLAACQPSSPDANDEASIEFFRPTEGEAALEKGDSIALSWKALGASKCSIRVLSDEDSEAQSVACEGEGTYSPEITTTYRFSALQEGAEAVTQDLEIVVTDPAPEGVTIEYFRVEDGDTQIVFGDSVTLAWKALNATDCELEAINSFEESGEPQSVDCDGEAAFTPPPGATTYRFSARQAEGEAVTSDLTINVITPEPEESVILTFTDF